MCAFIWGEFLSHQRGLDGRRRDEARGWLRTAGDKGVAEAWLRLGIMCIEDAAVVGEKWEKRIEWEVKLMERDKEGKVKTRNVKARKGGADPPPPPPMATASATPNSPSPEKVWQLLGEAQEALEKACEGDLPEAHLQLALLLAVPKPPPVGFFQPPPPPPPTTTTRMPSPHSSGEGTELPDPNPTTPLPPPLPPPELTQKYIDHLTKAAASGVVHAMYYLGSYYLHNYSTPGMHRLGLEWIQVAAHGGQAKAMKVLGELLEREGKNGEEWKMAGEWQEVVGEVNRRE